MNTNTNEIFVQVKEAAPKSEFSKTALYFLFNNNPAVFVFGVIGIALFILLWFPNKLTVGFFYHFKFLRKMQKRTIYISSYLLKIATIFIVAGFFRRVVFLSSGTIALVDDLAILGTILAIVAWRESAQQNEDIKEIANSLPTRYIGAFPKHLSQINKLVASAQSKICIMTDCVDYGSFSNPDLHKKMIEAIEAAGSRSRGVSVEILICGRPQPISRSSQFRAKWEGPWSGLWIDEVFQECLKDYLKLNPELAPKESEVQITAAESGKEALKKMLMRHHRKINRRLQAKKASGEYEIDVFIWRNRKDIPGLFFWMADDVEAVFLLSHTGTTTQGLAFQTRDAKLIEIFKSTFDSNSNRRKVDKAFEATSNP